MGGQNAQLNYDFKFLLLSGITKKKVYTKLIHKMGIKFSFKDLF
jgi:hypothetical protein